MYGSPSTTTCWTGRYEAGRLAIRKPSVSLGRPVQDLLKAGWFPEDLDIHKAKLKDLIGIPSDEQLDRPLQETDSPSPSPSPAPSNQGRASQPVLVPAAAALGQQARAIRPGSQPPAAVVPGHQGRASQPVLVPASAALGQQARAIPPGSQPPAAGVPVRQSRATEHAGVSGRQSMAIQTDSQPPAAVVPVRQSRATEHAGVSGRQSMAIQTDSQPPANARPVLSELVLAAANLDPDQPVGWLSWLLKRSRPSYFQMKCFGAGRQETARAARSVEDGQGRRGTAGKSAGACSAAADSSSAFRRVGGRGSSACWISAGMRGTVSRNQP